MTTFRIMLLLPKTATTDAHVLLDVEHNADGAADAWMRGALLAKDAWTSDRRVERPVLLITPVTETL